MKAIKGNKDRLKELSETHGYSLQIKKLFAALHELKMQTKIPIIPQLTVLDARHAPNYKPTKSNTNDEEAY